MTPPDNSVRWPVVGRVRVHYAATTSTMDSARALARAGYPDGVVVTTDVQTAGRGRLGRRWTAAPGTALLCTVVLRPALPADRASLLSVAAALATHATVEAVTGQPAAIKWPNDILSPTARGLGKVAGVLLETALQGEQVALATLGIGVNLCAHPPDVPAAADLAEVARGPVSRAAVLDGLLAQLATTLALCVGRPADLVAAFRDRLVTLGRPVQITDAHGSYPAVAEDIDEVGALLVRLPTGQRQRLLAGDVTLSA